MEHFMTERGSEIVRKISEEKIYVNNTELKPLWETEK
jgi:hypothetical protein